MKSWWRRVRGAVGTGLTWAVVWAPMAVVIGTQVIDPTNKMDEMWWMVGALPGFLSGVIFAAVLSAVARRRQLEELSEVWVGAWGALAGCITGVLPFLIGDAGGDPLLPLALVVIPAFTIVSGMSAAGSLALARRTQKRALINTLSTQLGDTFPATVSISAGMTPGGIAADKTRAATHEPPAY